MRHFAMCVALTLVALCGSADAAKLGREIKAYPHTASVERAATIRDAHKRVKPGMTAAEVATLLGEPDEVLPLYESATGTGKLKGYTQWYVIQRLVKTGSDDEKQESSLRVTFGFDDRVTKVEAVALDRVVTAPATVAAAAAVAAPAAVAPPAGVATPAGPASPAGATAPDYLGLAKQGTHVIRNFGFASGESLPELKISYATWGTPVRDRTGQVTNAILLCHGTTNSWQTYASPAIAPKLLGPGKPFDIAKHFVIASDAIGAGKSSKPSDGLRMKFPKYRIEDVVKAQHHLLTEGLKVNRLHAVLGISYGGRQTWQWAVQHPEFMQAAIPIVSSPFPNAGRRGMQDFLGIEPIVADPSWKNGDYTEQPRGFQTAWMMFRAGVDGAGHLWEAAPTREQSFAYLPELAKKATQSLDANDFIYQMRVNDGFDAFSQLDRVKARILIINMATDELVPVELGHAETAKERLGAKAEYVLIDEAAGYGHLATAQTIDVWAPKVAEFLGRLDKQ